MTATRHPEDQNHRVRTASPKTTPTTAIVQRTPDRSRAQPTSGMAAAPVRVPLKYAVDNAVRDSSSSRNIGSMKADAAAV